MPAWLTITLAVCSIVIGPLFAHLAAKRGAQQGIAVSLAVLDTHIKEIQREIALLRNAKHEHANRLTEHGADLHVLKRKAGLA